MAEKNQHFNIQELADKWAQGKLTLEEQAYLEKWYSQFNDEHISLTDSRHANTAALRKAMLDQINAQISQDEKPVRSLRHWKRISVAASVLIAVSIGGYYISHKKPAQEFAQSQKQDIAPGKNQATLTLANGQKILLNNSLKGKLAQQGNTSIQMQSGMGITYANNGTPTAATQLQYNTLSTARGEVTPLPLVLGDGTKVWLNAASSITYPVAFAGTERKVTVTGEALFEVVHNAAKPFLVSAGSQTIQDIGTSFDVNAYTDEPILKTTLIEGSVKVSASNQSVLLKPGQQSQLFSSMITVKEADVQEAIAWKNGVFRFSGEKLSEIMLQASRWYDVEVIYDNNVLKDEIFGAITTRFSNASQLLRVLEMTGEVKFKIEGKKITVFKP